jgi:transcriptional regulator with XRE-family HTH domain
MPNIYQDGIGPSSGIYTNMVVSTYNQTGKYRRMKNGRSNNIEKMRIERGLTREQLAAKLDTTPTTIYRKERGDRQLRAEELEEYASALGCSPKDLVGTSQKVQVVGYVGAGSKVYPLENTTPLEMVDSPIGINDPDVCAVYVRGDSQEPQLEDGWVLFFRKQDGGVPSDCIGRLCVVELADNGMLVKKLRQGSKPDRYHLLSKNADPILDAELLWASKVIDIRPS